jgi:hypothetical protein
MTTTAALRTARDTVVCADCGRAYTPQAKPRWAFAHDGRLVGSVHQMHTTPKDYPYWTTDGNQSPEAALFQRVVMGGPRTTPAQERRGLGAVPDDLIAAVP